MVRLQKFLAEAGVASRRASEKFIVEGRVSVNGEVVTELGTKVDPAHDEVLVDGNPVRIRRKIYVAIHKPPGFVCTNDDPLNRRKLTDLLPLEWKKLYPVGRLDYESEGLIFATNDGDFCLKMTHPRYGIRKKYIAVVEGRVPPAVLQKMTHGIEHEGETLRAEKARFLEVNNSHSTIELELAEGKNREVRRLFESQGFVVVQLRRFQIGPIKLGELRQGRWRALTAQEIKSLLGAL